MRRSSNELNGYMQLAAAILNSGYKENDKQFTEGPWKWWHDTLKEGIEEWMRDQNQEKIVIA